MATDGYRYRISTPATANLEIASLESDLNSFVHHISGKPENSMINIFMAEKLETENLERQNIQEYIFREGKFQACLRIQE